LLTQDPSATGLKPRPVTGEGNGKKTNRWTYVQYEGKVLL